jgi:hypothetical protein
MLGKNLQPAWSLPLLSLACGAQFISERDQLGRRAAVHGTAGRDAVERGAGVRLVENAPTVAAYDEGIGAPCASGWRSRWSL